MTFFSCRLLTTPIFPRRLSSVLAKFSHKKIIFSRVSHGAVRPLVTVHYVTRPENSDETRYFVDAKAPRRRIGLTGVVLT